MQVHLTKAGAERLNAELDNLKQKERPTIIRAIAEAREHGDLSENAEYHAAREKQSFIEGRIKTLEGVLGVATVVDPTALSGTIKFGATVKLFEEDIDAERQLQIVGEYEANIDKGFLNIQSPLAKSLIGKEVGDVVEVRTPGGIKSYEIIEVQYI